MNVVPTRLAGVVWLCSLPVSDERGQYVPVFEPAWAEVLGVRLVRWGQTSNGQPGTLRGLHGQQGLGKLVRVAHGAIYDVVVDLRPDSDTHGEWTAVVLTAEMGRAVYVPAGCAHGYLTLRPESVVQYGFTGGYVPDEEFGVRWDDPQLGIDWPLEPVLMSERDRVLPLLSV